MHKTGCRFASAEFRGSAPRWPAAQVPERISRCALRSHPPRSLALPSQSGWFGTTTCLKTCPRFWRSLQNRDQARFRRAGRNGCPWRAYVGGNWTAVLPNLSPSWPRPWGMVGRGAILPTTEGTSARRAGRGFGGPLPRFRECGKTALSWAESPIGGNLTSCGVKVP